MTSTRRERIHEQTREQIKQVARQQMAEQGTAAISLRAIANRMEMRAPSLYNYFASRDDLLTALIVDAFTTVAEALEQASESRPSEEIANRLLASMLAYRAWAVKNPTDFMLVSGNPIPGYVAPEATTDEVARRGMLVFFLLVEQSSKQGKLRIPPEYEHQSYPLRQPFVQWCEATGISLPVAHIVLVAFAQIQGLISQEVYGLLQNFVADPALFYRLEAIALLQRLNMISDESELDASLVGEQ